MQGHVKHHVSGELNFANKFIVNTILGRVLFTRYINTPITLIYDAF